MDWHPEDIKSAIRKRGSSIAAIARENNIARQSLNHALRRPNKDGEKLISAFLKLDAKIIWPSRYYKDGRRKTPQPAKNYNRQPHSTESGLAA